MTDLSAPEVQSDLKKLQRTTIVTNAMMGVVTIVAASIAIWAGTLKQWTDKSWAEIFFFILLGMLAAYFVFVIVWEIKLRQKISAALHGVVADGFKERQSLFKSGSEAHFDISLAGDKLIVMREGCPEYAQLDLSPIKSFTGACSGMVRYATDYVRACCSLAAQKGEITQAYLTDSIRPKQKKYVLVENGAAVKDASKNYFVKHGMVSPDLTLIKG